MSRLIRNDTRSYKDNCEDAENSKQSKGSTNDNSKVFVLPKIICRRKRSQHNPSCAGIAINSKLSCGLVIIRMRRHNSKQG